MNIPVNIVKVLPNAQIPVYATAGSAAFDIHVCLEKDIYLNPGECKVLSTGLAMEFSREFAAIIIPRSGLGAKSGIVLGNLVGLIDSDYRGTWGVTAWNRNHQGAAFKVSHGDRIAQCMIVPVLRAEFNVVDILGDTARGAGGFGSTGIGG